MVDLHLPGFSAQVPPTQSPGLWLLSKDVPSRFNMDRPTQGRRGINPSNDQQT